MAEKHATSDGRTGRVLLVAHCLMNATTRLHGISKHSAVHPALAELIATNGVGIVQLPCPEAGFLGMDRWAASREQYDTPVFRRHCAEVLEPVLDTLEVLARDGVEIVGVWGVAGSPSCGAEQTSTGFVGGLIDAPARSERVSGSGVFFEVLAAQLEERGIAANLVDAPEGR